MNEEMDQAIFEQGHALIPHNDALFWSQGLTSAYIAHIERVKSLASMQRLLIRFNPLIFSFSFSFLA